MPQNQFEQYRRKKPTKFDQYRRTPRVEESPITEETVPLIPQKEEPIVPPEPARDESRWKGMFDNPIWNFATEPLLDLPSRAAREIGTKQIFEPMRQNVENPFLASIMGFMEGANEGLGDFASELTTPLNLATAGLFKGGSSLAAQLPRTAQILNIGGRVASAPVAMHGGSELFGEDKTLAERGMGLAELAGGLAGVTSKTPKIKVARSIDEIPDLSDITPEMTGEIPLGRKVTDRSGIDLLPENPEMAGAVPYPHTSGIIPEGPKPKLNLRLNNDGTYVNKDTGEVISIDDLKTNAPDQIQSVEPPAPGEKINPSTHIKMPVVDAKRSNIQEILNFPRAIQAAYDISFPFRQGLGLIHTKGWWNSWDDMLKSYGSEEAFRAVQDSILQKPNYINAKDVNGKVLPSFAEESGLALVDLTKKLSQREEMIQSSWAEKIPGVRASNRAYTAFANKLRSDNFDSLIEQAERLAGDDPNLNPRSNMVLAKNIASYVNNASGRGGLGPLEKVAVELNGALFSPRLIASRLQMMNPRNYVAREPFVRKQYLKSMLAMAGAWTTMASLAKLGGAEVNMQPTNADFGKIKIGNTRFDPGGGFQQYLVLLSRLVNQGRTSSAGKREGKFTPYGQGYRAPTFIEDLTRFAQNKLAPIPAYAADFMSANERFPFQLGDRTMRMFAPIIVQDLSELLQEDPSLLPGIIPSAIGLGTQTYGEREPSRLFGSFFPSEMDIQIPRRR